MSTIANLPQGARPTLTVPPGQLIVRAAEVCCASADVPASALSQMPSAAPATRPPGPPAAVATQPAPAKPITLKALVEEWTRADRASARTVIWLGKLAYLWVRRQSDRPAAVRQIRDALRAQGFRGETVRVNRFIGCYWTAKLFGDKQAEQTGVTILRSLIPLLKRDAATELWQIRAQCRAGAVRLWQRIAAEKLNAAQVQRAVEELRPPRLARARRRRSLLGLILQRASRLDHEQLETLVRHCQARLANLKSPAA